MEPVAIPKTIDDPIHLLLWSADEIVPFMVCMLTGMLIDQFIPALAIGAIAVKFYCRFRSHGVKSRGHQVTGSGLSKSHKYKYGLQKLRILLPAFPNQLR